MVDGDATYDASSVQAMVDKLLDDRLDMLVGSRVVKQEIASQAYRNGHQWGNKLLTNSVSHIFGGSFKDMLSGYRVFSKRYVKSFPALSRGFEIETELTVHTLALRMPYAEYPTPYGARLEGSSSKLATYRDGWRILKTIIKLYISERPLRFFSWLWFLLTLISLGTAFPVISEFLKTGLVPRLPTAFLSASIMLCAFLFGLCGLILNNVVTGRYEMKRLLYLSVPAPTVKEK
jgi:hypothetical protein